MSAMQENRPDDDGQPVEWTDPRYAHMVAHLDEARSTAHRRGGSPVLRAFVYQLPEDRRPPAA